jgi:hypothetical protein
VLHAVVLAALGKCAGVAEATIDHWGMMMMTMMTALEKERHDESR